MRVAIVASSFLPERGRLERRVAQLAHGLARRGAEVEILTQGPARATLRECQGLNVRRFPGAVGPVRVSVAPQLWERLRSMSEAYDVVDVHCRRPALALAAARAGARRLVLTPGAPMDAFCGWPYTRAMHSLVGAAAQIVCHSELDRDLLCQTVPTAAERTRVLPDGVDAEALRAAHPFDTEDIVVLAVDRLDRGTGVGRAIAAMPGLGSEYRLVVVGDGPARTRLSAYAADLGISSRVQFAGAVPDAILYRWLRTARVVVALADERGSGSQVTEARAAGVPVVASDLPGHRRAAEGPGAGHVIFVTPKGSPLDVADAIEIAADEAARVSVLPTAQALTSPAPTWESVIDSTALLYQQLTERPHGAAIGRGAAIGHGAAGAVELAARSVELGGGPQWP
jgi:glycosyltransferase involved in cell wall biosynthesis